MLHNGRFFGSFVSFLYCLSSKTGKFFLKKWKIIQPCSIWWEYMVCPDRIRNSSRLCRLQWSIRMFEPGKIDPLRVANQSCIPHDWRWASSASCRLPYRLESKRVKFVMQPFFSKDQRRDQPETFPSGKNLHNFPFSFKWHIDGLVGTLLMTGTLSVSRDFFKI